MAFLDPVAELATFLRGRRFVALTGAGCSTESGIPDYRGAGRSLRHTIQHDAFLREPAVRRRYWARATLAWDRFSAARPNPGHLALAELEQRGHCAGVITQNVDRLHRGAGSLRVVELHGALADVRCLACDQLESRDGVHTRLRAMNPSWLSLAGTLQPDGDSDLPADLVARFEPANCIHCGGDLKPDVVFFGGNVSVSVMQAAWELFEQAQALLVVGSSLTVYSGFRFVRRARERALPIAILNLGRTRADDLVELKIEAPIGLTLCGVVERLAQSLAQSVDD